MPAGSTPVVITALPATTETGAPITMPAFEKTTAPPTAKLLAVIGLTVAVSVAAVPPETIDDAAVIEVLVAIFNTFSDVVRLVLAMKLLSPL